jgi:hypothetical protein
MRRQGDGFWDMVRADAAAPYGHAAGMRGHLRNGGGDWFNRARTGAKNFARPRISSAG